MLEVSHISKVYKKKVVLSDASFSAEVGKCVGILGKNGTGKSTLLSVLAGILKPDSGSSLWEGKDLIKDAKFRTRVQGYVPQGIPLFPELSAIDNLSLWYPQNRNQLEASLSSGILQRLGIKEFIRTPVSRMSGGMKKRLSIACAVANNPKILLLDEPSASLDIICKEQILDYLGEFCAKGGTAVLVTHDTQEIEFCDSTYMLSEGKLSAYQYSGDVKTLVRDLENSK